MSLGGGGGGGCGPHFFRIFRAGPLVQCSRGNILVALSCSQLVVRNNGFCGRQRRRRFFFGRRQGEIFLFDPMCLCSKYSEFCGELKWMKNTKKDIDPDLTSGSDLR